MEGTNRGGARRSVTGMRDKIFCQLATADKASCSDDAGETAASADSPMLLSTLAAMPVPSPMRPSMICVERRGGDGCERRRIGWLHSGDPRGQEGTSALNLVPDPAILEGAPYPTGNGSARRAPGRGLTCSVPTKLWPRRRASSWASMTTLMAFSVKRCWRGGGGGRVQKVRVVRLVVPRWFFFSRLGGSTGVASASRRRARRGLTRGFTRAMDVPTPKVRCFRIVFGFERSSGRLAWVSRGRTSNMALVTKRRPRPERPANPRV